MTDLALLAAAAAAAPTRLDPVELFLDADIVVQVVMLGLLLASVWVWMIIVSLLRCGSAAVRRRCREYEERVLGGRETSSAVPRRARQGRHRHRAGRRRRAAPNGATRPRRPGRRPRRRCASASPRRWSSQVAHEADELAERLNFLATVGSVAPFVGLFGTVWGIMNSFFQIGQQQNSSLAVVAPGISEALFATAIGLFAAIPAVIAYNRFSHRGERARGAAAALRRPLPRAASAASWSAPDGDGRPSSVARGARGRRAPMAEINVTPLVDVMLVLLIIFMVTAPLLTAGVPVELPDSRANALDQEPEQVTLSHRPRRARSIIDDDAGRAGRAGRRGSAAIRCGADGEPPLVTLRADRGARLRPGDGGDGRAQPRRVQLDLAGHQRFSRRAP